MHRVSNKAIFSAGADRAAERVLAGVPNSGGTLERAGELHAPGASGVPPRIALVRKFNRAKSELRLPPFQFAVAA